MLAIPSFVTTAKIWFIWPPTAHMLCCATSVRSLITVLFTVLFLGHDKLSTKSLKHPKLKKCPAMNLFRAKVHLNHPNNPAIKKWNNLHQKNTYPLATNLHLTRPWSFSRATNLPLISLLFPRRNHSDQDLTQFDARLSFPQQLFLRGPPLLQYLSLPNHEKIPPTML